MAVSKLGVIGWLFIAVLVSGLCYTGFAGRLVYVPLAVVHKLLALLCLFLLLRSAGTLRGFHTPPILPAAIVVFAVAYLASFVTGGIQSIPACASSLWLNLHRGAAGIATSAFAVAARFIALAVRS